VKTRKFFVLSLALAILMGGAVGLGWALEADYNREVPLMDYAPQEVGIYDTRYDELCPNDTEPDDPAYDCRVCHGNSMADRHHYTDIVILYRRCTDCHTIDSSEPNGVTVTRNCVTPECHQWPDDIGPLTHTGGDGTTNGWHHDSELSFSKDCTGCHDRKLIAEIPTTGYESFATRQPSVVTPTPFSCDNCHWSQDVVSAATGFDPDTSPEGDAGHPSTYDHYNQWGQKVGYFEYEKIIFQNDYTHHLGGISNFGQECYLCHGGNPDTGVDWDPENPELSGTASSVIPSRHSIPRIS